MSKKEKQTTETGKRLLWQQMIGIIFFIAMGAVCGFVIGRFADMVGGSDKLSVLLYLLLMLLSMYVSIFAHIIIHEMGHLVFGLLSGYRFCSFRVFSLMWIKTDGGIKLKRHSVAGTGGQCLMDPPELNDGKCPVALYNLGGSLMNVSFSVPALVLCFFVGNGTVLPGILLIFSVVGLIIAAMNGIPMRLGLTDNDGYNAFSLRRNKEAMRSFWIQMKVNKLISDGKRLREMPQEWFAVPDDRAMKNSMTAVLGVFACNRLMDEERFSEADELMAHLLEIDSGIIGLHRAMMTCDRLYCELIAENRADVIEAYLTKEQRKLMKSMKGLISVIRTEYALALRHDKDEAKAAKLKAQFERRAKTYPYASDIEPERALMHIAEAKAGSNTAEQRE